MPDPTRQVVLIPNLFTSFLASAPLVNPHYSSVREESEKWLASKWQCDQRAQDKIKAIDFSYFCAILAPHANYERFRLICDWGNWIFPFDDLFDDGELRNDSERARSTVEALLAMMQNVQESASTLVGTDAEQRLIKCHFDIWSRFQSATESVDLNERYKCAMQEYCKGALRQVQDCSMDNARDVEDLLVLRRLSIGAEPLYALVEFGHQLEIPDYVLQNDMIKQIRLAGVDIILIQNDIISYRKEELVYDILDEFGRQYDKQIEHQQEDGAAAIINARYNNISLDPELWKDVRRIHVNKQANVTCDWWPTAPSRVRPQESVEELDGQAFLSRDVNLEWIKGYLSNLYPVIEMSEAAEDKLAQLEIEMAGETIKLSWSFSLVLATRK
ncbi:hypothetical protein MBLNU13_g09114t2 [Cladosporium sp. NU13]